VYVMITILILGTQFSVQAPNIVFNDMASCLKAKTLQNKILDLTKPDADARHITNCFKITPDIQA
jgi:hypothetical protein